MAPPESPSELPELDSLAKEDRNYVSALARGLAVLEAIGQARAPGNTEVAAATNLPKATVARFTATLLRLGYIIEGPGGRGYQIGSRAMALGYSYIARHDIGDLVQPVLRELSDTFPCATSLVTREHLDMIYLAQARPRSARLLINIGIGSRVPMALSAGGRAYLAGSSPQDREMLLAQIATHSPRAWPSIMRSVQSALKEYAEHGFCMAFNVDNSGINAVSTPLRSSGIIYALTCAAPAILTPVEQMRADIGPTLVRKKIALQSRVP